MRTFLRAEKHYFDHFIKPHINSWYIGLNEYMYRSMCRIKKMQLFEEGRKSMILEVFLQSRYVKKIA